MLNLDIKLNLFSVILQNYSGYFLLRNIFLILTREMERFTKYLLKKDHVKKKKKKIKKMKK